MIDAESDHAAEEGAKPLLELQEVTIRYGTPRQPITATSRVSFSVNRCERYVIVGPSGCGKSSLMKAIGGFIKPANGEIRLEGKRVERPGPDRVMVFQEFDQLLAWKTVHQNVTFALIRSGVCPRRESDARARFYVDKVGLAEFGDAYPHTLSGGMKQRVALARAMAMAPRMLLMDEPFAALDALTRERMQRKLLKLWREARTAMIFVTHSIEEACAIGHRILVLSSRPGRVVAQLVVADYPGPTGRMELEMRIRRLLSADADD